ncbi:MAG: ABC transporter permease subunit [Actinomycetes bacterium]
MSLTGGSETMRAKPVAQPPTAWHSLGTVVRSGLRSERFAPLTWGLSLGATCALIAAMWPSVSGPIQKAIQSYPSGIKQAFGITELNSVEQYVDAEMLSLVVPLAMAYFAVRCSTRLIVGAEERGYLDSLLSLPLSRRVLVAGSLIVTAIVLLEILAVCWAMTWVAGTVAGTDISARILAEGFGNVWPLSMAFAGLAILLAGILHHPSTVTAIAAGTLVAMYVVDLVGKISPELKPYRIVSAFRYYGSAVQNGINLSHILALVAISAVLSAVGALLFDRRDIR